MDQRVAAIKSVALNYIAKGGSLTPEPPKRPNPPSASRGAITYTSIDGQRELPNLGNLEHREYMYYENEIQITLDLDFSETVGREESIRASIQRDIAYAIGGDPDKVWVGALRAGSIVAEVRLEKGCVTDSQTFSDVVDDLQHQVKVKESRLMNGNITRHTIKVCHVAYHEAEALTASPVSPVSVNSTIGGDLTAWAADETLSLPVSEATERSLLASAEKDIQRASNEKSAGLSWLAGSGRVARNLFDKLPLGPMSGESNAGLAKISTVEATTAESASNSPINILHPQGEARANDIMRQGERQKRLAMPSNDTRNSWRITSSAADAMEPNPTPSVSLEKKVLLMLIHGVRSMSVARVQVSAC